MGKQKKSKIIFYKKISTFFKENFPEIKMVSDIEKQSLINELAESSSFAATHSLLSKLSKHTNFSEEQKKAIVDCYLSNNQIYSIITDYDVENFIRSIINENNSRISPEKLAQLTALLTPE